MAETWFKKGERKGIAAKNWCPIGTIRSRVARARDALLADVERDDLTG